MLLLKVIVIDFSFDSISPLHPLNESELTTLSVIGISLKYLPVQAPFFIFGIMVLIQKIAVFYP